jgi:hypothetical protein
MLKKILLVTALAVASLVSLNVNSRGPKVTVPAAALACPDGQICDWTGCHPC